MKINRAGSQPSQPGPPDWFTGQVRIDPLCTAEPPGTVASALVTFEPGARTNWHTHPKGQTLIVTAGRGLCQEEGGEIQEICSGDVVWFPAGVRHWHGASPETAMAHIALQESEDGAAVSWQEPVADEAYQP